MKVFLIGFMGVGKTHVGKQLSEIMGLVFSDLDAEIEAVAGRSISDIFSTSGEGAFREIESSTLLQCIEKQSGFVIATGGGAPCFEGNLASMKNAGIVVWIDTPSDLIAKRLKAEKTHRPLIANLNDEEMQTFIVSKNAERMSFYRQADIRVHPNGHGEIDLEKLVEQIRAYSK